MNRWMNLDQVDVFSDSNTLTHRPISLAKRACIRSMVTYLYQFYVQTLMLYLRMGNQSKYMINN